MAELCEKIRKFVIASFVTATMISLLTAMLIPIYFQWGAARMCGRSRRASCMKNLSDLNTAVQAYSQSSLKDGGGDGYFPYQAGAKGPEDHLQLLVNGGFVTDRFKFKCPAGKGPFARINENFDSQKPKPWTKKDAPFILTSSSCYYGWNTKGPISDQAEDPKIILTGDRWIRDELGVGNNHRDGGYFLESTGKTVWRRATDSRYWSAISQLQTQSTNPDLLKKKWESKLNAQIRKQDLLVLIGFLIFIVAGIGLFFLRRNRRNN